MGFSFAAGTTDGPGAFDFKQGTFFELLQTLRGKMLYPVYYSKMAPVKLNSVFVRYFFLSS